MRTNHQSLMRLSAASSQVISKPRWNDGKSHFLISPALRHLAGMKFIALITIVALSRRSLEWLDEYFIRYIGTQSRCVLHRAGGHLEAFNNLFIVVVLAVFCAWVVAVAAGIIAWVITAWVTGICYVSREYDVFAPGRFDPRKQERGAMRDIVLLTFKAQTEIGRTGNRQVDLGVFYIVFASG